MEGGRHVPCELPGKVVPSGAAEARCGSTTNCLAFKGEDAMVTQRSKRSCQVL